MTTVKKIGQFHSVQPPDKTEYLISFCHKNLHFLISEIRALWRSGLSARMSEIKKVG